MPRLGSFSSKILHGLGISHSPLYTPLASFSQTGLSQQGGNYVAAVDFGYPNNKIQFIAAVSEDPAIFGGIYDPTLSTTFQTIYDSLTAGSVFTLSYYNNASTLVTIPNITLSSKTLGTSPQGRPQLELSTVENLYAIIGSEVNNELLTDNIGTVTFTTPPII